MEILNSKLELNRCLIPTLVTEDRRPKPYQMNIKFKRDEEEEEVDEWDEDENLNKRGRTQDIRRKKPTKRRKNNKPNEEPREQEEEIETIKRKPNQMREERPTKTRKKTYAKPEDNSLKMRNEGSGNQTQTSSMPPNHNQNLASHVHK